MHHSSTLFTGIGVFLAGHFPSPGPAKAALESLLSEGGATVVGSAEELLALRNQGDGRVTSPSPSASASASTSSSLPASPAQQLQLRVIINPANGEGISGPLQEAIDAKTVRLSGYLWVLEAVTNYACPPLTP
jgi:hypothetical protein